ncbi:hypothetical protein [Pseudoclavibacter helvolus]|uniref:hypothetical protein n=1 Tax=Pseudoclavibacter helvolus TaxID=255205 RepID=UPI003C734DCF
MKQSASRSVKNRPSRRAVLRGAAWSAPVLAAAVAAPMSAASGLERRGVVGGDMYHLGIWNMASQIPIDSPFTLTYSGSEPVRSPSDFSVDGELPSRWVGNDAVASWVLPATAGFRLSNIVVVFPWCGNSPTTTPVREAYAAQWSDTAGRWLNEDTRLLPNLQRPQEGNPGYATTLVTPGIWATGRSRLARTPFSAHRPLLGSNDFVFTRSDGASTMSTTDDSASIFTISVPITQLNPGEGFTVNYTALREVAWYNNNNRFHGYGVPAFVIADYTPIP